jgi:hypothetical protein
MAVLYTLSIRIIRIVGKYKNNETPKVNNVYA